MHRCVLASIVAYHGIAVSRVRLVISGHEAGGQGVSVRSIVGATARIISPSIPYARDGHTRLEHDAKRALVLTR
jgi:hypothetical protein